MEFDEFAKLKLSPLEDDVWRNMPDKISVPHFNKEGDHVPYYKICNKCEFYLKVTLFNKASTTTSGLTAHCKECQKMASKKSYKKNKHKIDHKERYQRYQEQHLLYAKENYAKNKDKLRSQHKEYMKTKEGQKVMQRSHSRRKRLLKENTGVPWKKEYVIERDTPKEGTYPICYLCDQPIENPSQLQIDHVIPVTLQGMNCFTNVACTHALCNLRKSKNAREIMPAQVDYIEEESQKYITKYPDKFDK